MKLRYEGFSPGTQEVLADAYTMMASKLGNTLQDGAAMTRWFGAADRTRLFRYLNMMAAVVRDPNRTLTFVNRIDAKLKVEYKSLYNPQLLPVGHDGLELDGTYAYAFPTDRRSEIGPMGASGLMSHVGSGMRIYIANSFFGAPAEERAWTVYHELTHKVLATEDHSYDPGTCLGFAAQPAKAMNNAENYGLFWRDC
ncbi:M35 family metallo-endopeptidase [Sandarakinorhabdus oryzae]|uniref:M35 family metallo-endopeptidase n=1 Tax=Sandarakinorhabdus oryzae TaxID=2675220 RepID=UPI0018CC114E|nr:M35 family metallo-endopeptidase [Sandarakinorhabdus oryzae]